MTNHGRDREESGPSPVTLLELARRLGVSKAAVSLALRNRPGVSAATRKKVVDLARELGYAPNPVATELMALVRSNRAHSDVQTIAFVNTYQDPTMLKRIEGLMDFVTGARAQASNYGYTIEVFEARARGMTGPRLAEILRARGIRGVLLGPRWGTEPELEFSWEHFAVVLVGEPESGPHLHRVCNHHLHACVTALRALSAKGYRRIGLALVKATEAQYGYDFTLGVEQFRRTTPGGSEVEVWLYDRWDDAEGRAWAERHALDAVISLAKEPAATFTSIGTAERACFGYANLNLLRGSPWSGIDQHTEDVGAAAVDLLRGLLLAGERGTSTQPRVLLVEGGWVEGKSTLGAAGFPRPGG